MGIYDRDYYRKEGPSYIGSWADSGKVIKWLVALNGIIWLLQVATAGRWIDMMQDPDNPEHLGFITQWLSMQPEAVFYKLQVWRLVTGMFLHDPNGFYHILFNMLMLWFIGRYMEDHFGHKEFLAFYLVAGVVGNLAWGLTALWTHQPGEAYHYAFGASGAVMGVVVLCAFIYPGKTIYMFWFLPVPLWAFALIYVGGDLFIFLRGIPTGVGVAAHLGGAAFALLYLKLGWQFTGRGWGMFLSRFKRPLRPRLKIYREEKPAAVASAVPESKIDEQLEAKADAILEKMHRQGKESLTTEEREILQQASEQYRKKRS